MSRNSAGDEFLIGLNNRETETFLDYRRRALLGTTARPGLIEHLALYAKHSQAFHNLFAI